MKKRKTIGLACVLALTMTMGAHSLLSGAAGYEDVTGYEKVWDFETWEVGEVLPNGGDTTVSPIRSNGDYTATITDEWNYLDGQGKSIKFDSDKAHDGCISFDHPTTIAFKDTAYNALVFAVKAPKAPASDASEKGYSLQISLNDWGTYYNTMNPADTFRIQEKGSSYWKDVAIQDETMYIPYGFEGLVKVDIADFYEKGAFPSDPEDENYAADVEASRLKDNEIQHEVVIEIWLPASTGGAQGAFYMDDIYLRTPEATDVDEKEPETPVGGPKELSDFEAFSVGDNLFDAEDVEGSGVWNGYTHTVTASDQFVGNGEVSAEFSGEENRQTWNILTLLKTGDGNIQGKKYLVMHIATPDEESSKSPAYEDANGNRRFAFAVLPKTETNGAGHWFKTNTTVTGNVQMMADGEATWKPITGDDFYNYLPFGWSGWIKYDLSSFAEGSLQLEDTMTVTGIEVYTSQCGGRFGKVYLDSFFALDEEDELPVGISAKGNKNGTDPETPPTTETEPTNPPYMPDLSDPTDSDPTTGTTQTEDTSPTVDEEDGIPPTGVASHVTASLVLAAIAVCGLAAERKMRRRNATHKEP